MEVTEDFHLHNEPHVHDHVGICLVRLVELGERNEKRRVVGMGHGDAPPNFLEPSQGFPFFGREPPPVGYHLIRQTADEPGYFDAALIVDESADSERLPPETIGLCVKRKNFHLIFSLPLLRCRDNGQKVE